MHCDGVVVCSVCLGTMCLQGDWPAGLGFSVSVDKNPVFCVCVCARVANYRSLFVLMRLCELGAARVTMHAAIGFARDTAIHLRMGESDGRVDATCSKIVCVYGGIY